MNRNQMEGWQGQYHRMLRWRERAKSLLIEESPDGGTLYDFVYAFFQNCYHLRDWLVANDRFDTTDIQALFDGSIELQYCRDICNSSKHFEITRPSIDSTPKIAREIDLSNPNEYRWYLYADKRRPLGEMMDSCVELWDEFLKQQGFGE